MRKIIKHFKKNWYKYGLETLVVIVGVLVAFTLNDWKEKKLLRLEEVEALNSIMEALKQDKADMEGNINRSKQVVHSSDILLNSFQTETTYHDSLAIHFARAFQDSEFHGNNGPYEALKAKGLDLISNDSLRKQINYLYDFDYVGLSEFVQGFVINDDYLKQQLIKYFDVIESYRYESDSLMPGIMKPHDFEALKNDDEFKTILRTFRAETKLHSQQYQEIILFRVESLIADIGKEIESLK